MAGVTEGLGDSYVSSESSDSFEVGFGLDSVLESTMSTKSTELSVLVGFEDLDFARARAARRALKAWQPRRVKASTTTLYAVASRLRQDLQGLQGRQKAWILSAQFRSNATGCQKCTTVWTVDCPEKCTYQYGAIEAVCEGLKGIDLVFWDSDGSAADGWLLEWLSIERACAPRFVLLLNLFFAQSRSLDSRATTSFRISRSLVGCQNSASRQVMDCAGHCLVLTTEPVLFKGRML